MTPQEIGLSVYLGVAFVAACVCWEFRARFPGGEDDAHIAMMMCSLWPPLMFLGGVVAGGWLLSWTVRGPIRLVCWIRDEHTVRRIIREADAKATTMLGGSDKSIRCADSKAVPRAWTVRR